MIATVLAGVGIYLAVGLAVALAFALVGAERVDPAARGAGLPFRLVILPGAALIWPFVLVKWLRSQVGAAP
ncbi:MAG: hypothetical protein H6923_00630 [Alphaproteobacteria bacterium]|nr:hypothetical protein [Alphaproteobacteria bacterium]